MNRFENINMINCGGMNCYILRCMSGDVLIDTGAEYFRDEIETWLLNYSVKLIVLTSGTGMNTQNAQYFSELYNAPIAVSEHDAPLLSGKTAPKMYRTNSIAAAAEKLGIHKNRDDRPITEADIILSDGMRLCDTDADVYMTSQAIELDGHTRGTIGILDGTDLYCGDALSNVIKIGWPSYCQSPAAAKRTMKRIAALAPERIFFGFGEPVVKGDKAYNDFMNAYGV